MVQRLTQELQHDDKEREEEHKQKEHEDSSKKKHWRQQARKKPGPQNKVEDEGLKERFPDGEVSFDLNQDQCVLILFIFSVSFVTLQRRSSLQDLGTSAFTSNGSMLKPVSSVNGQDASM